MSTEKSKMKKFMEKFKLSSTTPTNNEKKPNSPNDGNLSSSSSNGEKPGHFWKRERGEVFGNTWEELLAKESAIRGLGNLNEYQYIPMSMQKFTAELERPEVLETPGIYRVAGSRRQCELFRQQFNQTGLVNFSSLSNTEVDFHTIADSFKQFIREVPGGILATWQQEQLADENSNVQFYQSVLSQTPQPQQDILVFLCLHLRKVASHADVNKMTNSNLARVFGPNLFEWKDAEWTDHTAGFSMTIAASAIFGKILDHFDDIFGDYKLSKSAYGIAQSKGSFSTIPREASLLSAPIRKDWESEGTVEFHSRLGTATTAQSESHGRKETSGAPPDTGETGSTTYNMSAFYHQIEREVSAKGNDDAAEALRSRNRTISEEMLPKRTVSNGVEAEQAKLQTPADRFLEQQHMHRLHGAALPTSAVASPSYSHISEIPAALKHAQASSDTISHETSTASTPFDSPIVGQVRSPSKLQQQQIKGAIAADVPKAKSHELCPAISVEHFEFPAICIPDIPASDLSHSEFRELKDLFLTFHNLLKEIKSVIRELDKKELSGKTLERRRQLQKIFRARRPYYDQFKTYLESRKSKEAPKKPDEPHPAAQIVQPESSSSFAAVDMLNDLLVKLGRKLDTDLPDRLQLAQLSIKELDATKSKLKTIVSTLKIADKTPELVLPGYEHLSQYEKSALSRLSRQELRRSWFEYCEIKKLLQEKRDQSAGSMPVLKTKQ